LGSWCAWPLTGGKTEDLLQLHSYLYWPAIHGGDGSPTCKRRSGLLFKISRSHRNSGPDVPGPGLVHLFDPLALADPVKRPPVPCRPGVLLREWFNHSKKKLPLADKLSWGERGQRAKKFHRIELVQ